MQEANESTPDPRAPVEGQPDGAATTEDETENANATPVWHAALSAACGGDALCFSIQAASNRRGGPLLGPDGIEVPHAVKQQVGPVYKYRVGSSESYAEACRMRDTLRQNGFPDAFVVAFEDGQRIPLEVALKKARN